MASGPESGSSSGQPFNISANNGSSVNAPIMTRNTIGAIHYHTGPLSAAPQHTRPSSPMMSSVHDFLKTHKNDLENRMCNLRPILSNLIDLGVLSEEDREEIEIKTTRTKKNEALLTMVINKGKTAQEHFYQALKKADRYLVKDLEG
ncbi:NACHT, LRR and PYD domains-containing protein 1a allele 5-like [Oncorhynchus keta]|uniref:NACHT, LRR and PYD domains-containing protein 1a allele 5-like n=1 Tax=Oncorhynchus keta TaxID=8018 RepID=UPI00227AEF50|nr:NACHT, LRR and PYD domains-containing protein 1a allele 5-like [Oncorhynchus keta]